jgi:hypothetical protein
MAQTATEIKDGMIAEKANHPELTPLDSDSNTSVWGLWMFVMATILVFFEQLTDTFQGNVQTIIDNNQYGTDPWWYKQIMAFQFGDSLVYQDNVFQYPAVDPTKQIIGFCAITSTNGVVQIKVAANSGGSPAPLTTDQYNGVVAYAAQIQPSGIKWAALSQVSDTLKLYGVVYYDATQDLAIIQPAVYAAINGFLNGLNTVQTVDGAPITQNFNGTLYVNKLVNAIQAVTGLVGNQFDLTSIAAAASGEGYTSFSSSYQPESGYLSIDAAYPLSTTLTFVPFQQ